MGFEKSTFVFFAVGILVGLAVFWIGTLIFSKSDYDFSTEANTTYFKFKADVTEKLKGIVSDSLAKVDPCNGSEFKEDKKDVSLGIAMTLYYDDIGTFCFDGCEKQKCVEDMFPNHLCLGKNEELVSKIMSVDLKDPTKLSDFIKNTKDSYFCYEFFKGRLSLILKDKCNDLHHYLPIYKSDFSCEGKACAKEFPESLNLVCE